MPDDSKLLGEWFWTDRWMGSSAFLLPIEPRGLYREMLTQAWRRECRLPNDHEAIRRAVGCTVAEWKRCWPRIEHYWRIEGAHLLNDTQIDIWEKSHANHLSAQVRGRKGGLARSRALAQLQAQLPAEPVAERKPPDPSPDKERTHTLSRAPARLAYAGKVLEVPKFLDRDFVKRLNGQAFDLAVFYDALDQRLAQTGEAWDLRWIREQFDRESPAPERRRVVRDEEDRPISPKERTDAERVRRSSWGGRCGHEEPRCQTAGECVARIVRERRAQEAA